MSAQPTPYVLRYLDGLAMTRDAHRRRCPIEVLDGRAYERTFDYLDADSAERGLAEAHESLWAPRLYKRTDIRDIGEQCPVWEWEEELIAD